MAWTRASLRDMIRQRLRALVHEQNIYRWAGKILSTFFKFEFQEA